MSVGLGWIPEKYDPNDKPYRSRQKGAIKPGVNLSEEHPEWLKEIYDQSRSNSCVANATAAAYRFLAHKLNQDTSTQSRVVDDPSRLFIYYNARLLPKLEVENFSANSEGVQQPPPVQDKGSENRDAFKGLNIYGVCAEKTWPFIIKKDGDGERVERVNTTPPQDAYKEAIASHAVEYCRLDPDHSEEVETQLRMEEKIAVGIVTLMQLKQCLSEGYPVVFGFWYYWKEAPWTQRWGEWELPELAPSMQHTGPPKDGKFGGHTVLAIGYDESRKQVLCQNSWGPESSQEPRFWIPYSWITDWEATDDFWMIRLIERK